MITHGVIFSIKAEIHEAKPNNEYGPDIIAKQDELFVFNGTLEQCQQKLTELKEGFKQWLSRTVNTQS